MMANDSLNSIERRAYRSTFSDGVYDIAFGAVFILLALIPVLESIGISRYYGYLLFILPALMIIVAQVNPVSENQPQSNGLTWLIQIAKLFPSKLQFIQHVITCQTTDVRHSRQVKLLSLLQ